MPVSKKLMKQIYLLDVTFFNINLERIVRILRTTGWTETSGAKPRPPRLQLASPFRYFTTFHFDGGLLLRSLLLRINSQVILIIWRFHAYIK